MQASKASAPLFLLAGLASLAVLSLLPKADSASRGRRWRRDLPLALAAAAAVAALFYSSFLSHPGGLRDAFLTYLPAGDRVASGGGHDKLWDYYLGLFLPRTVGGYTWSQLPFALLALGGASACFWAPREQRPFLRFWSLYTLLIGLAFSLVPYKTPWLVVHLIPGLALLGGGLAGAVAVRGRRGLAVGITLVLLAAGSQWRQLDLAVYLRPGDTRNPLAYVHPSPDVRKVRPLVEAALARHPDLPVRIVSPEVWPLPWYLRGLDRVGYWAEAPADCDGALVIVDAAGTDAVRARLTGTYTESFLGLRPGFVLIVFTRQS
jgi:predicted membrane-bound mannosyltransferase